MDSNNSIFNLKKLIEGIYLREHEELTLDHLMIALLEIPELDHLFSSTGLQMTKIKNDLKDETDKSYKNSELRRRLEIHRSQDSYELEKLLATLEKVESPSALFVFLKVLSQSANAKNFFYDSVLKSTPDVLAKLKNGAKLVCKPAEPNFCLNVHVSCAGKTNYQAFAFELQTNSNKGSLTVAKPFDQFNELYASANVEWSDDSSYMLISPAKGKGYIKMFQNGKYVFRYYPPNQEGIMSLGMCEQ